MGAAHTGCTNSIALPPERLHFCAVKVPSFENFSHQAAAVASLR
jgi:hypothetical protein